jgi:hypothetical protein
MFRRHVVDVVGTRISVTRPDARSERAPARDGGTIFSEYPTRATPARRAISKEHARILHAHLPLAPVAAAAAE